jgi:hypothetical protein
MKNRDALDDAIFTCDVGTPIIWTARYLKVNGRRRIMFAFTVSFHIIFRGRAQAIRLSAPSPPQRTLQSGNSRRFYAGAGRGFVSKGEGRWASR